MQNGPRNWVHFVNGEDIRNMVSTIARRNVIGDFWWLKNFAWGRGRMPPILGGQ